MAAGTEYGLSVRAAKGKIGTRTRSPRQRQTGWLFLELYGAIDLDTALCPRQPAKNEKAVWTLASASKEGNGLTT
jgi:hypothetical protein